MVMVFPFGKPHTHTPTNSLCPTSSLHGGRYLQPPTLKGKGSINSWTGNGAFMKQFALAASPRFLPPIQLAEAHPAALALVDCHSTMLVADAFDTALRLTAVAASLVVFAFVLPLVSWAWGEWRVSQLRARRKAPVVGVGSRISPDSPAYVRPQECWTPSELARFAGDLREDGPILVAVDGLVYNVASARHLYGPGGEYEVMAGTDATRSLARNSIEPENPEQARAALNLAQRASLAAWKAVFARKYDAVGRLVSGAAEDASGPALAGDARG